MATSMAINEIKDHLSKVIAQIAETGEAVAITKHGRVVAMLTPAPKQGVVLGVGARPDGKTPELEDLHWTPEDLSDMFGAPIFPS
jgi:prevent-host-death family protein